MLSGGSLHTDMPVLADEQELIYICSVWTQDLVWKNCGGQCIIGKNRKRETGKSMQSA